MELRVPVDFNDIARMIRDMEDVSYVEKLLDTALNILWDYSDGKQEFDEFVLEGYLNCTGRGLEFL